jgi:ribosome-associated protein
VEGYRQGEWILVDYVDFVVHVFSEKARKFYDLERLWKTAKRLEPTELSPKTRAKKAGSKTKSKVKAALRKPTATSSRGKKA